MPGQATAFEPLDDVHAPAAAGTGREDGFGLGIVRRIVANQPWFRRRHAQQFAGLGEIGGAVAVGEHAVMADAVEAVGHDVQQEAADELSSAERHHLHPLFSFGAVVLIAEGDAVPVHGNQAAVADGDAVGVAAEICQDGIRPGERSLGVDMPLDLAHRRQMALERSRVGQPGQIAEELQFVGVEGGDHFFQEQPPEQHRQNIDRQEEALAAVDPVLPVDGYAAAGHDDVSVRVPGHRRTPCVQHGSKADLGAQMLGIGGDRQQRLSGRLEQDVADDSLVLIGDRSYRRRQGEHHMVIRNRQQFRLPVGQPGFGRHALTFGAVAVATGVIGDAQGAAVGASIDMTAEGRGAAFLDRRHHLRLPEAQMTGVGMTMLWPKAAEHVRHFEQGA